MAFESERDRKEPETREFEKLEFLPEEPDPVDSAGEQGTGRLVFTPEAKDPEEPPISFNPNAQSLDDPRDTHLEETGQPDLIGIDFAGRINSELDLDAETPFELVGSSLFDEDDPVLGADDPLAFGIDEPDDGSEF